MSVPSQLPKTKPADFRRALRFLIPHGKLVIISVVCALLVGAAFTGGLGAMLPIMRVLISGDSVQGWVNRKIVENRLQVQLVDRNDRVQILKLSDADGPAAAAGLGAEDRLILTADPQASPDQVLETLSAPQAPARVDLNTGAKSPVALALPPLKSTWAAGRRVAYWIPGRDHPIAAIATVFGVLTCLALTGNVFRFFQEYLSDKASILAVNDIRRRMYDRVLHVPLGYFGSRGTSDVTSRLVQDTANLQDGFKNLLGPSVQEPIKVVMAMTLALLISWKLVLFIVLFAPVMGVLMKKFGKKMRRASRKQMQSSAVMLGQLEGTLMGIRVVKSHNAERFERRRYGRIMHQLISESLRMSRIDAISAPVLESLTLIVAGVIVLYSAHLVLVTHTLQPTEFIMVMVCLASIGESLRRTGKINNVIQKANAASGRLFELMDLPVERPRQRQAERPRIQLPPLRRQVTFENITFSYPGATTPALEQVDLSVQKGQSVAIVGRNGSGKSTLLALLLRFYDPQEGRVTIDGVDVRQVTLKSLRARISIVTQDSVIFPGTIAENIAYGNPLADAAAIEAAARKAFAHDFIMEKPQGYQTLLDGLGGQLSGGQKQRLCIARAIFRDTPLLILDEATSQVDAESEHLIQQAVEGLMRQRTTFVIAHRFSTILSADRIVVLEKGHVVGQGRHEQLLQSCEIYQQLYERQLFAPAAG